jgi:hypothetical protein
MPVLLEPILNQFVQAEMTEHLKAELGEHTDHQREDRNGGATGPRRPLPDASLSALPAVGTDVSV